MPSTPTFNRQLYPYAHPHPRQSAKHKQRKRLLLSTALHVKTSLLIMTTNLILRAPVTQLPRRFFKHAKTTSSNTMPNGFFNPRPALAAFFGPLKQPQSHSHSMRAIDQSRAYSTSNMAVNVQHKAFFSPHGRFGRFFQPNATPKTAHPPSQQVTSQTTKFF